MMSDGRPPDGPPPATGHGALAAGRGALAGPGGTVLVADEKVGDSIEENRSFVGRLCYNFSVLHCLPQAMTRPGAAGTGTVMRPSTLRAYARESGFAGVEVLPIEHPLWRFYRLAA